MYWGHHFQLMVQLWVPNQQPQYSIISLNLKVARGGIDYLSEKKNKTKDKKEFIQEYGNYPRNVIQFPREANLFHPTQKPMNLMEYLIMTYSKEGELVLDFTSGSGSTLLACERINRRWIGIELTDKYCEVIKKRIQDGIQLKMMLDYNWVKIYKLGGMYE